MILTERSGWRFAFPALFAALALSAAAAQTRATMIDLQCAQLDDSVGAPPGQLAFPTFSGAAVVGAAGDYWNSIAGMRDRQNTYFGVPLKDVAGNSTPVTMNFFFGGYYSNENDARQWPFTGTPFDTLMSQYAFGLPASQLYIRFINLAPGAYDLYLLSSPSPDATARVTQFTATTATQTLIATAGPYGAGTFQEGVNYVHLQPTVGDDGRLTVLMQGVGNETNHIPEADLNGFQLISAPEPQGLWIAAAPMAGLLLMRRGSHGQNSGANQ